MRGHARQFGLPADGEAGDPHRPQGALQDIRSGDTVWKYGQDIGKAVADIAKGEHVHTHNLKTKRW